MSGSCCAGKDRQKPPPDERREGALSVLGGGETVTTNYITDDDLGVVYRLLMPQNRLICMLAERTGLRISDVLDLKTADLKERMTVKERKTGKSRRISIAPDLLEAIRAQAGPVWAFPGAPGSKTGHKTRQAVWRDLKRAQRALRLPENLGPHSLRKVYAVKAMRRTGDLGKVQRLLNHNDPAVTLLYALADHVARQQPRRPLTRYKKRSPF